jgi:hypothetical protein
MRCSSDALIGALRLVWEARPRAGRDVEEVPVSLRAFKLVLQVRVGGEARVRLDTADPGPLFRLITEAEAPFERPVAATPQETDFRVESVADLRVAATSGPLLVDMRVHGAPCVVRCALAGGGIGSRQECRQSPVGCGLPSDIETVRAVEIIARCLVADALTADEHRAEVRSADFPLQAQNREIVGGRQGLS